MNILCIFFFFFLGKTCISKMVRGILGVENLEADSAKNANIDLYSSANNAMERLLDII